LIANLALRS